MASILLALKSLKMSSFSEKLQDDTLFDLSSCEPFDNAKLESMRKSKSLEDVYEGV